MEGITRALAIIALLALWIAVKAGCIGAAYWFEVTFPTAAQRVFDVYTERPKRCFIVGLVNVVLGLFIVALLLNAQPLALLGLLLLGVLLSIAVLAYVPAYRTLAERSDELDPAIDGAVGKRVFRSGLAAEALYMAPALGQALSAVTLLRGFGAVVLTWLTSRKRPEQA